MCPVYLIPMRPSNSCHPACTPNLSTTLWPVGKPIGILLLASNRHSLTTQKECIGAYSLNVGVAGERGQKMFHQDPISPSPLRPPFLHTGFIFSFLQAFIL